MAATGLSGSIGSDSSSYLDRINRYGYSSFYRGENVAEGLKSGVPLDGVHALEFLAEMFQDDKSMQNIFSR